jgi:hypothetical protein
MTVRVTRLKDNSVRIRLNASEYEALNLLVQTGRQRFIKDDESTIGNLARGYLRRPPFTNVDGPIAITDSGE